MRIEGRGSGVPDFGGDGRAEGPGREAPQGRG